MALTLLLSAPIMISLSFLATMIELPYVGRYDITKSVNKIYFPTLMSHITKNYSICPEILGSKF
jgi:hypothetical protein